MWGITKSDVIAENGECHETYGICKGNTVINDISLSKKEVDDFVKLLNMLNVSETHARDIVEDFLGK